MEYKDPKWIVKFFDTITEFVVWHEEVTTIGSGKDYRGMDLVLMVTSGGQEMMYLANGGSSGRLFVYAYMRKQKETRN